MLASPAVAPPLNTKRPPLLLLMMASAAVETKLKDKLPSLLKVGLLLDWLSMPPKRVNSPPLATLNVYAGAPGKKVKLSRKLKPLRPEMVLVLDCPKV